MHVTLRSYARLASLVFLCCTLLLSGTQPIANAADAPLFPAMHPDDETFARWMQAYNATPKAYATPTIMAAPAAGGSTDLLPHLSYVPSERNQGACGNCWAWAGTGCLEIALDQQTGIHDRLSVQYINSCQSEIIGKPCCEGGWLASDFVPFYKAAGICIPWSNQNAHWHDVASCGDNRCSSISTEPNYTITNIGAVTIPTHTSEGVPNRTAAIANIKSALDSGQAVWFAFFVPTSTAWSQFESFWLNQGEGAACVLDSICSGTWRWGGHAVLCVGYNDQDPHNRYWVMLNSWGTTTERPNGLFRVNMDMDYNATCGGYAFYWQALDVSFRIVLPAASIWTAAATDVAAAGARLNGTLLDDAGSPRECRFVYGPRSGGAYQHATEWQHRLQSGHSFHADVTDLSPGTVYHFAAEARNGAAMDRGGEEVFLTKPLPPASFSAYATGQTSASITWALGAGASRTIIRGKQGSIPTGPEDGYLVYDGTGTSAMHTGLEPGTAYFYRAWSITHDAVLGSVQSDASSEGCARTIGSGVWMVGDVTLDAHVSVADAVAIMQFTIGSRELSGDQLRAGDTTGDGRVSVADAVHIMQFTIDPDGAFGILAKPLWRTPVHDGMLDPLKPCST